MTTKIRSVLMIVALSCVVADAPKAHAVVPPPDGGYPNFTTAEGTNALKNLTTGAANTAVGWFSLFGDTTASFNTGVGAGTLLFNNGDQNTAVGAVALLNNTTGSFNTATGVSALSSNTTGVSNNAFGWGALLSNTFGSNNTAIGVRALQSNTEGGANVAVGETALSNNTTGRGNTVLGYGAGSSITTGSNNVYIGAGVSGNVGESNTTRIANISTTPIVGATSVVCDAVLGDTRLGYNSSSRRYKEDIKPVDKASEALFALKPVSFRAKKNMGAPNVKLYGLIAEEVATVDPDLVVYNPEGQPQTVRFDSINAMLLNEFLKVHRKNEQQETTIAGLKKEIASLVSTVKEQAAQIQKVSAQVEASKSVPRIVLNNQ